MESFVKFFCGVIAAYLVHLDSIIYNKTLIVIININNNNNITLRPFSPLIYSNIIIIMQKQI